MTLTLQVNKRFVDLSMIKRMGQAWFAYTAPYHCRRSRAAGGRI